MRNERFVTGNRPAPTRYTLSQEDNCGLANVNHAKITRFSSPEDKGRLIVRRHKNLEIAETYIDAICDHREKADEFNRTSFDRFQNENGIFTISHCGTPEGTEDLLVIYVIKTSDPHGTFDFIDHWTIVRSDGTITNDEDILWK